MVHFSASYVSLPEGSCTYETRNQPVTSPINSWFHLAWLGSVPPIFDLRLAIGAFRKFRKEKPRIHNWVVGFNIFVYFHPLVWGKMILIWRAYFFRMGWNSTTNQIITDMITEWRLGAREMKKHWLGWLYGEIYGDIPIAFHPRPYPKW